MGLISNTTVNNYANEINREQLSRDIVTVINKALTDTYSAKRKLIEEQLEKNNVREDLNKVVASALIFYGKQDYEYVAKNTVDNIVSLLMSKEPAYVSYRDEARIRAAIELMTSEELRSYTVDELVDVLKP